MTKWNTAPLRFVAPAHHPTDNFTPLTRVQKEAFLACTNWGKAHGHDAADAAFKAKIAEQLEDDSVTSFNLFETFAMWAADCTGTTAEVWRPDEQDFLRSFGEEEIAAALKGEKKDPLTLTPQEAARVIMVRLRLHLEDAQSVFANLPIFLPCLNKTAHFAPDRLTHGLLTNVFLVGIPSNGGATRVHGHELSPLTQIQHDISHGYRRLFSQIDMAQETKGRIFSIMLAGIYSGTADTILRHHLIQQYDLFSSMLARIHADWRETDTRLPLTALFWMLHETTDGAYPNTEIFGTGLESALKAFIEKTASLFTPEMDYAKGTSFLEDAVLNEEEALKACIAQARTFGHPGVLEAADSEARIVSVDGTPYFVWNMGGEDHQLFRVRNNFELRHQIWEDMPALLKWAGVPDVPALPKETGEKTADEAAWKSFRDTLAQKAVDMFHETADTVQNFFETDKGRDMEREFREALASINAHLDEEAKDVLDFRPSLFLDTTDTAAQADLLQKVLKRVERNNEKLRWRETCTHRGLARARAESEQLSQEVTEQRADIDRLQEELDQARQRIAELENSGGAPAAPEGTTAS